MMTAGDQKIFIEKLINYEGLDVMRRYLSKQYKELVEDNPTRAREGKVLAWYARKWEDSK